jgi:hypothetical protein
LSKHLRVFLEEKERKAGYKLLLAGRYDLNAIFLFFVVVVDNSDRSPNILLIFVDWGKRM